MKKLMKFTGIAIIAMAIIFSMMAIACDEDDGGNEIAVTDVFLNKATLSLVEGVAETLTVTILPDTATNQKVTWSSSDDAVATVVDGTVTGLAGGTAVITVTTVDGGKTDTCAVTVTQENGGGGDVAVTGVSLNKDTLSLGINSTEKLTATIAPDNATNQKVTWSSDKPAVATVTNGTVTAVAAGSATITVTTEDGEYTADCEVSVIADVPVTGVSLNKTSTSLNVGGTERLTATVMPTTATNKTVTWSSGNTSVATVASDGTVTGLAVGTAVITVTTVDGGKTATCDVTVSVPISVTGVTLNKLSASLIAGATETLTATVAPSNAVNKNVTWSSSNTTVARVSNGTVTAVSAGSATITVTTVDGGKTATCNITVIAAISVNSVSLDKPILNLAKNARETLTATVSPSNATNKAITWSSSNTAVATVANGVVTGVFAGTATITVTTTDGGKTATCTVTIPPTAVTGVTLKNAAGKTAAGIFVSRPETLTATISPDDATNKAVTWSSSILTVATVSQSGVVTGVATGIAIITVTTADGNHTATFTANVSATEVYATSITLDEDSMELTKGGTKTLTVSFVPDDKVTNRNVTWTSNKITVATVSNSGLVTGTGPGEATITATAGVGLTAVTATCDITVPLTAATLGQYLATLPTNTAATAASIELEINASDFNLINTALKSAPSKYVNLNISESAIASISSSAFSGCTTLAGITMPDTVTSIANSAFSGCTNLQSVAIPSAVTSIGNSAFNGCTSLTEINVPSAVTSIGGQAFRGCAKLATVDITDNITSVGEDAFTGTKWLNDKADGLVYLGKVALVYKGIMAANTNISIDAGTKVIAGRAFYNSKNLVNVTIQDGVTGIGEGSFQGCTGLISVTMPASVTSIGNSAFQGCTSLASVTLSSAVTSIGNSAFQSCTGITAITLPNTITSIGNSAFSGCTVLTSVIFQGTIPSTGLASSAFPGDLRTKYLATTGGGIGTYTRPSDDTIWTKQD
jgi:uncharacterized protein YjdB